MAQDRTGAMKVEPGGGGRSGSATTWEGWPILRASWTNLVRLAALAVALWYGALVFMTLTTANRLTVSQPQIAAAERVVVARVVRHASGRIDIETVLKGSAEMGELTVANLPDVRDIVDGGRYVIPLSKHEGEWYITRLPEQGPPERVESHIYPATPEVRQQVHAALHKNR